MDIYLLGYMGSGKSTVGKQLAASLHWDFVDLDTYIEKGEGMQISQLFEKKGEIYFRKKEIEYLKKLIANANGVSRVISLGGGTPCFGTNMELINESEGKTIYLNVPFKILAHRLWNEKAQRPLIARMKDYEELEDFVRKHLFERSYFYHKAEVVLKINRETSSDIVEEIISRLF